jgi:hypothetical protein
LIPRVQSPANFRLVSQMSTLPGSARINRDMAKVMSMVYALRLEGENKKRLLVGRLKIASRRAEMHLLHGTYVVDKYDTGGHCMGDGLFDSSKQAAECSHSFEKISCYFVGIQTPIPSVCPAR